MACHEVVFQQWSVGTTGTYDEDMDMYILPRPIQLPTNPGVEIFDCYNQNALLMGYLSPIFCSHALGSQKPDSTEVFEVKYGPNAKSKYWRYTHTSIVRDGMRWVSFTNWGCSFFTIYAPVN